MKKYKLMIKTADMTGKKYLCVTIKTGKAYDNYKGSGSYWRKYLKKTGSTVSTELLFDTDDVELFEIVCKEYSTKFDVVKSNEFANLVPEYGHEHNNYNMKLWKESIDKETYQNMIDKRSKSIKDNHWINNDKVSDRVRLAISKSQSELLNNMTHDEIMEYTAKARHGMTEWFDNLTEEEYNEYCSRLSNSRKEYLDNLKEDEIAWSDYCNKISESRLNMSEESKQLRKKKIQDVYATGKHNEYFKRLSEERKGSGNPSAKKVSIDGVVYGSTTEAADKLNISVNIIRNRAKSDKYENYEYI